MHPKWREYCEARFEGKDPSTWSAVTSLDTPYYFLYQVEIIISKDLGVIDGDENTRGWDSADPEVLRYKIIVKGGT